MFVIDILASYVFFRSIVISLFVIDLLLTCVLVYIHEFGIGIRWRIFGFSVSFKPPLSFFSLKFFFLPLFYVLALIYGIERRGKGIEKEHVFWITLVVDNGHGYGEVND